LANAVLISGIVGASDRWFIKISLCTKSAFQHRLVELAFFGLCLAKILAGFLKSTACEFSQAPDLV